MLRKSICALALLAAGTLSAHADGTVYKDPAARFEVTVPEGWESAKPDQGPLALVIGAPSSETSGGICLIQVRDLAETRSTSQADIDAAMDGMITREFWTQILAQAGANAELEESGTENFGNHHVQYVVASVDVKRKDGTTFRATGKQVLFSIPGSMHFINCTAKKELFAAMAPQFEKVYASYLPRTAANVAEAAPRSVLTLFAGGNFDGAAHVVAQDTPNVPALAGVTQSAGVAGFGQWEVCDGVNFTGTCRQVAAGLAGRPGAPIRIASARRIAAPALQSTTGLIAAATAATFHQITERVK